MTTFVMTDLAWLDRVARDLTTYGGYGRWTFEKNGDAGYVAQHGYESWELDALPPAVLDGLITAEIEAVLDRDAFDERLALTRRERNRLTVLADRWDDVSDYLDELGA